MTANEKGDTALCQGIALYKEFIDHLVDLSRHCVDTDRIMKGKFPGVGNEDKNALLSRLSESERQVLADIVLNTHVCAIYDVLDHLEWLSCCRRMTISIEGEALISDRFEGFSCDYVGRRSDDWDWPEWGKG